MGRLLNWVLKLYLALCCSILLGMLIMQFFTVRTDGSVKADVIVVLGASLTEDGELGNGSRRRVEQGVALYKAGLATRILFSGGSPYENDEGPTAASVMAKYAYDLGVPATVLLEEGQSHSTLQNILFTRNIMRDEALSDAILVTEGFHIPRSYASALTFGMPVVGFSGAGGWFDLPYIARAVPREMLAWPFNILRGATYLIALEVGYRREGMIGLLR